MLKYNKNCTDFKSIALVFSKLRKYNLKPVLLIFNTVIAHYGLNRKLAYLNN